MFFRWLPADFLLVGDYLPCIANNWGVKVENDVDEVNDVNDRFYYQHGNGVALHRSEIMLNIDNIDKKLKCWWPVDSQVVGYHDDSIECE